MNTCDTCDKSFDTSRGMKIHKSMVHGPPKRACDNCNDKFKIPPDNKDKSFCSRDCYIDYGNVTTTCDTCNEEISICRSRFERTDKNFCSRECINFEGKENPFFGKTHDNLSDKMPSGEDHWMYGRKRDAHSKLMKELHSGENNPMYGVRGKDAPNWQGGNWSDQSWRRTAEWYDSRQSVLDRDNHKCVNCGKSEQLHVHHITPVSNGGEKFDEDNLVTLCKKHHYDKHRNS